MPTKSILKILDHSIRLNEANVYAAAAEVIMLNKTYFINPVKAVIKFTGSLPHNLNKGCLNGVCGSVSVGEEGDEQEEVYEDPRGCCQDHSPR